MHVQQSTITANGLEFGLLEVGDGPLALCLHGFPDTAWTWRHLLPDLAAAGFRAVAPFLRGYAPTTVPADGAYQTGALAADAVALHDELGGDDQAVIIGHDWGAMAAYGAASYAPERWRRVVTLAVPPPNVVAGAFFNYAQLKRSFYVFLFQTPLAEAAVAKDDLAFLDGLWRDWEPGYDSADDVAYVKAALRDPRNLSAAISYYRAMLGATPPQPEYAAFQIATGQAPPLPTLYLHGSEDGALGADLLDGAQDALAAGSEFELLDGLGHFLHLHDPAGVNRRIVDWVTR